jgi:outer membrane protein OmpA-like peptidoglycan-associated protein
MKLKATSAILLPLLLSSALWAARRNAAEVVLGDDAQDTDCSYARATPVPPAAADPSATASATASPTPSATPDTAVDAIQALGFAAEWEGTDVLKVTLSDVSARFDTSKAKLKPEAVDRLKKLAGLMGQFPGSTIQVDGHTDPHGYKYTNTILSLKRAQTVRDVMVSMGIPAGTFVAVSGWAATRPLNSGTSEEEVAQNRRVEVRVHMGAKGIARPTATAMDAPTPAPTVVTAPVSVSPEPSPAVPQKPEK